MVFDYVVDNDEVNGMSSNTTTRPKNKQQMTKVTFCQDVQFRQKQTPTKVKRKNIKHKSTSSRRKSVTKSTTNKTKHTSTACTIPGTKKTTTTAKMISSSVIMSPQTKTLSTTSLSPSTSIPKNAVISPPTISNIDELLSSRVSALSPTTSSIVTSNCNHRASSLFSSSAWKIPNRGVCIDTRILETFNGNAVGQMFHQYTVEFLKSASIKGLCPSYLSTTTWKSNVSSNGTGTLARRTTKHGNDNHIIEAKATQMPVGGNNQHCFELCEDDKRDNLISLLNIKPPSNVGNTKNRTVVHVPRRLLASDSWRTFGNLGKFIFHIVALIDLLYILLPPSSDIAILSLNLLEKY
jgi:hypothetical protein